MASRAWQNGFMKTNHLHNHNLSITTKQSTLKSVHHSIKLCFIIPIFLEHVNKL